MRIDVVNSRVVQAPPERLAPLVDGLGGPGDRLWPAAQWPATVLEVERPLRVGSRGSHGSIRHTVAAYEPGRRVDFTADPACGLTGGFSVSVEGPAGGPSTVSVPLSVELAPRMRPLAPLLRVAHHAVVEDLLDNAERAATGTVATPRSAPLWLRALTEADLQVRGGAPAGRPGGHGQLARAGAVAVPAVLLALAAVHGGWALGWRWPGTDDRSWADRVIGSRSAPPPPGACWAVAAGLTAAAAAVRAADAGAGGAPVRAAARAVAAAFALRGAAGAVSSLLTRRRGEYERLDLAVYSPLCLAVAAGTTAVAGRAARRAATP
ncbi:hypothetical protein NUM3379_20610 [Kineococcus sp. NUM-3379]